VAILNRIRQTNQLGGKAAFPTAEEA